MDMRAYGGTHVQSLRSTQLNGSIQVDERVIVFYSYALSNLRVYVQ